MAPGEGPPVPGELTPERRAALRRLLGEVAAGPGARPAPAAGGAVRPASFGQERLWVLDQLEPGNPAYNVPAAHRLRGELDLAALQAAVDGIVRRHEALRSTLRGDGGRPVQVVAPALSVPVELTDVSGLPPGDRERRARDVLQGEAVRPFDLAAGPLLRAALVRLDAGEHVLLVCFHHAVADAWSLGVWDRELAALYAAAREGRPSPLPDLPLQYGDFAAWQRDHLRGRRLDDLLAHWRRRLEGAPQVLELPADGPRPPRQSFRGDFRQLSPGAALAEGVARLARSRRATPFMVIVAALAVLLRRLTGQEDLLIGTPVAGRARSELEPMIGFFLNHLVLRVDCSGRPSFDEMLDRAREDALSAYDHQDLPFERLLEELRPERDLARTPLFQVYCNHVAAGPRLQLPGLSASPYRLHNGAAKFDLTLYVTAAGPSMSLEAGFAADLFRPARMEELLRQYVHLLEQVVEAPDRPIERASLVTGAARRALPDPGARLDAGWRGSVPALALAHAEADPGAEAVAVDGGPSWSRGELARRAGALARRLGAGGAGRGDVVVIHARRGPELVQALLGTLWAGAAFAVLDPAYPPARLAAQALLCRPAAWIELAGPLPPALEAVAAGARCRVGAGELADGAGAAPGPPPPPPALGPDDLAYVAFTSGSSGEPRGVMGRHGSLTHFLPWLRRQFRLGPDDRFSMASGLAHDPLHRDVFTPLCLGAAVCCPPEGALTPGRLPAWLGRAGVTVAHLTPALGQVVSEPAPGVTAGCLPRLRLAFFIGDVLTRRDVARLRRLAPGVQVVNYYGSTETQRAVAFHVVREAPAAGPRPPEVLPLGRGIEDVQLLVLDAGGGLAGIGEAGEVHVRSPHLAAGYLGDAALTAERFVPSPFGAAPGERLYRTGDLGRYLPGGEVEPLGRADRQVKVLGHRVELGEIEAALGRHPAVRAATVSLDERPDGRRLVAHVVPAAAASDAELRELLRERLPDHMVPAVFVRLASLPLTPNGKVDHAALPPPPDGDVGADGPGAGPEPPAGALERELAAIWLEVLGPRPISRRDTLFGLGAGSLELLRVHARVRERFGEIPLVDMFRHGSLAALAERLGRPAGGGGA